MNPQHLKQIFACANEFKEGDLLVGGTRDDHERQEARQAVAALRLGDISRATLVEDQVSDALARSLDSALAAEVSHLTIAELRRILLSPQGAAWARRHRDGLSSESIAAAVKVMTDDELATVAGALFNPLAGGPVALGSPSHFGSRIQPNSPGDDEEEILFSIFEGLSYGCGDVILGINPASDDVETIIRLEELLGRVVERLKLPTRYCVLSDIVKQTTARARTTVDVGFQSLAGTSKALAGMVGLDVDGLLDLAKGFGGLYFETGQGSAVTNNAAEGVDMVTLEARNYGLARLLQRATGAWMIVNDVAGFIGPEVFRDAAQLRRACLEDTVMAKLHGLTMGLDVCSTFHMGIEPERLQSLTEQIVVEAAPAYLMAVAGNADPMLGYLTTSFREHPRLRRRAQKRVASSMQKRLMAMGVMNEAGELAAERPDAASLYASYMKAGGESRSFDSLRAEGARKLAALTERGFDLGYGCGADDAAPPEVERRMQSLYGHARRALYARLDDAVIRDAAPRALRVRTLANSREDYLMHPPSGESLCETDARRLAALYGSKRPRIQFVISDGLNANAVNENLRAVLPPLRRMLGAANHPPGDVDVVIDNGRVRAGYHVGALLDVEVVVHLIGERPGTGLNTLSAYLTYGRNATGASRWSPSLDHSATTAICGIHHKGKPPLTAAAEIVRLIERMLVERRSGVEMARLL
ncbi:MAG TPA: ethanolamine ammonia-lyase subunit EutB [Blastocatellia bacterium]|nr:ethanolamine ammonia-lyase subunit EutB [Blastocatellia bacterium]